MTLLSNSVVNENDTRLTISTLQRSAATNVSKRAPALPLPTPEGKSQKDVAKYR
jgi:hypothetical protein